MPRSRRALGLMALPLGLAALVACRAGPVEDVHARALGSRRLAGNVLFVDPDGRHLTLIDAGAQYTVTVTEKTIVRRGQADRSVHDLRRGDRVVVSLVEVSDPTARLIAIAGPPARRGGRPRVRLP